MSVLRQADPQDLRESKPVEYKNWPGRMRPMVMVPPPGQLDKPHQLVQMMNTSNQVHIIVDRFMRGHEFLPGQTKEVDMLAEDIDYFRRQAREGRRGDDGTPQPPHPVKILGIRDEEGDVHLRTADAEAAAPSPYGDEGQPAAPVVKKKQKRRG